MIIFLCFYHLLCDPGEERNSLELSIVLTGMILIDPALSDEAIQISRGDRTYSGVPEENGDFPA
jgi:hypothetical protein